jgi:LDH2 family malate/lactate/ureidoglycolate dehydrogenase
VERRFIDAHCEVVFVDDVDRGRSDVTDSMVKVSAQEERDVIVAALQRHGAPLETAEVQADWLVEADLRGQSSHGIARLPILVARIQAGLLVPDAQPLMTWRSQVVLSVDGARGFGPAVATTALALAVARAREHGISLVAISNAHHLGILAPYVEDAADEGVICVALTTSEALVHPWGGRHAMIGTNPVAIGVPAQPSPLVLDMATGQISMGKIIHHSQIGQPLEPGWAVDRDGEPTTDPQAALSGAISPFGGPKGFALGLAFEALVGSLTNSAFGTEVHGTLDAVHECNKGDVFICIDATIVVGSSRSDEVSKYLDDVRATPAASGSSGVRVPGDRSARERARRHVEGVEVAATSWGAAVALAGGVGAGSENLETVGELSERAGPTGPARDEVIE